MAIAETSSPTRPHLKSHISIPESVDSAIVFGHADADGHLAAEQTRSWLTQKSVTVTTVVSPETRNFRFWGKLPKIDLSGYRMVVCVDIAFSFRAPHDSLTQLLAVSDLHPHKHFVVIDHHSLVRPRPPRQNLQLVEVDDPYDCCLGVPTPELMEVAALCDGSPTAVVPTPLLKKRALGVKRAAADVSGVAGEGLLELIRKRRWDFFEALADEDREMHRSARGIRRRSGEPSPLLEYARSQLPSARTK